MVLEYWGHKLEYYGHKLVLEYLDHKGLEWNDDGPESMYVTIHF